MQLIKGMSTANPNSNLNLSNHVKRLLVCLYQLRLKAKWFIKQDNQSNNQMACQSQKNLFTLQRICENECPYRSTL